MDRSTLDAQISQLKQINENCRTELTKCYELLNTRKTEYENIVRSVIPMNYSRFYNF